MILAKRSTNFNDYINERVDKEFEVLSNSYDTNVLSYNDTHFVITLQHQVLVPAASLNAHSKVTIPYA